MYTAHNNVVGVLSTSDFCLWK